jgi:hypothetical protein
VARRYRVVSTAPGGPDAVVQKGRAAGAIAPSPAKSGPDDGSATAPGKRVRVTTGSAAIAAEVLPVAG